MIYPLNHLTVFHLLNIYNIEFMLASITVKNDRFQFHIQISMLGGYTPLYLL